MGYIDDFHGFIVRSKRRAEYETVGTSWGGSIDSVLFVCLGNICRSPTAEGVFAHLLAVEGRGLDVRVDSAGTADYHLGEPPDARSQRAARSRGIDLSRLRARQLTGEDFRKFDLILAMDRDNLRDMGRLAEVNSRKQLRLFMEFAPQAGTLDVPDPYYGGPEGFERVLDLTTAAGRGLIAYLRARRFGG
jgi:protein-tyrosine phosphatase